MKTTNSGFCIALALSAALLLSSSAAHAQAPAVGKPAPSFKMTTTEGKQITNASLKGKVVVIDFWATWCGWCVKASPAMQKLHQKYAKKGLVVIGANTMEENSKAKSLKYVKEHGYSYTFTIDNGKLTTAWGVRGIPQFYILDKKGVVRAAPSGYSDNIESEFGSKIEKLLAEK